LNARHINRRQSIQQRLQIIDKLYLNIIADDDDKAIENDNDHNENHKENDDSVGLVWNYRENLQLSQDEGGGDHAKNVRDNCPTSANGIDYPYYKKEIYNLHLQRKAKDRSSTSSTPSSYYSSEKSEVDYQKVGLYIVELDDDSPSNTTDSYAKTTDVAIAVSAEFSNITFPESSNNSNNNNNNNPYPLIIPFENHTHSLYVNQTVLRHEEDDLLSSNSCIFQWSWWHLSRHRYSITIIW
jgi:hypothetical protein